MNKKGFVMMETIIVITILSLGLISLYSSYSLMLSRATVKSKYDNIEYIYKTHFVSEYLKKEFTYSPNTFTIYKKGSPSNPEDLNLIMSELEIDRIYVIYSGATYTNVVDNNKIDGSTIIYLKRWNDYVPNRVNVIAKFVNNNTPSRPKVNFASITLSEG